MKENFYCSVSILVYKKKKKINGNNVISKKMQVLSCYEMVKILKNGNFYLHIVNPLSAIIFRKFRVISKFPDRNISLHILKETHCICGSY